MNKPSEPKMKYDQFIAMLVANAVQEIESQTGRKVESLSFPTPNCFEQADNRRCISVVFAKCEHHSNLEP